MFNFVCLNSFVILVSGFADGDLLSFTRVKESNQRKHAPTKPLFIRNSAQLTCSPLRGRRQSRRSKRVAFCPFFGFIFLTESKQSPLRSAGVTFLKMKPKNGRFTRGSGLSSVCFGGVSFLKMKIKMSGLCGRKGASLVCGVKIRS